MGRRRRGAGRLSSGVVASSVMAAAILMSGGRSGAEPGSSSHAAASLLAGPSLRETGRVGNIPLAHAAWNLEGAPARSGGHAPRDPVVRPRTGTIDRPHTGSLSASIIAHELAQPVAVLRGCRVEVARQQRRPWNAIAAGRATLHWTILPTGAVAQVEVAPIDPLDLHVLDCMKRAMARWTFAPPRGGDVAVAQAFAFR